MRYQIVTQDNWDDLVKAYEAGSCTVLTGDVSLLAADAQQAESARPIT